MSKGHYYGGSTLIGEKSGWFSKPLTLEERAAQGREDAENDLSVRAVNVKVRAKVELEEVLERQAAAVRRVAWRATDAGKELRANAKQARSDARHTKCETRVTNIIPNRYPDLGEDVARLFSPTAKPNESDS